MAKGGESKSLYKPVDRFMDPYSVPIKDETGTIVDHKCFTDSDTISKLDYLTGTKDEEKEDIVNNMFHIFIETYKQLDEDQRIIAIDLLGQFARLLGDTFGVIAKDDRKKIDNSNS